MHIYILYYIIVYVGYEHFMLRLPPLFCPDQEAMTMFICNIEDNRYTPAEFGMAQSSIDLFLLVPI